MPGNISYQFYDYNVSLRVRQGPGLFIDRTALIMPHGRIEAAFGA